MNAQTVEYLIVGNGMAGITAAQEIRHADPDGRIVLVGDEPLPYYYRASLSEWLSGALTDETLLGRTPAFYEHMRLEQVSGHVTRVEPQARRVHLDQAPPIQYHKLLIATGARANRFPVKGLAEPLVFRDWADVKRIQARMGGCGRALILGGGILGLELAGALHKMGHADGHCPQHIAVVQRSGFVGKPLLDQPAAEWLQAKMRADGIELFLGDTVARVENQMAHFQSGRTWPFDLFVQTVGITPVFPDVPGLDTGRGIRIDARARTNLPDIYAAGDCTETQKPGTDRWETTRIWLDCARQGKIAGRNMAADRLDTPTQTLRNEPFFNASIIYTVYYAYIGEPHGAGGQIHLWQAGNAYRKVRTLDGNLVGALFLGERHGSMALRAAVGRPVPADQNLAHPAVDWNAFSEPSWDYAFF